MKVAYFTTPSPIEDKNKLVILRIPTDKLDSKKLFVRSQNRFFEQFQSKRIGTEGVRPDIKQNLEGNTPAIKSRLYKNRKEAVEYIYKDDILIENVEQIGQVLDINTLDYDANNSAQSILQKCLEGEQERIAVNYLKTSK